MSAEARLKEKNIALPKQATPMANYVTAVRTGNLLFLAGHGPVRQADGSYARGKLGKDLSVEQGYQVAREVGLNLLATTRNALGSLDRVTRVVKVTGWVNSAAGFTQHPEVVNGASDLFVEIFGAAGKHARAAVGASSLPRNTPVEIEAIFEAR